MARHKILVIDNNSQTLITASRILGNSHYKVSLAMDGENGVKTIMDGGFSLVLLELAFGGTHPVSLLQAIRSENPEAVVVIQSEKPDASSSENIFTLGADDYIFRPYGDEELLFRIRKNIERYELKQKIKLRKNLFSSCCVCKKIRLDDNEPSIDRWREVEDFLKEEMDVLLSSTYCPKCAQAVQEDLLVQIDRMKAFKVCR